jgi:FkbM family methyltransferase
MASWRDAIKNGYFCSQTHKIYLRKLENVNMPGPNKTSIVNRLPMTRIKLFIARILYLFMHTILRKDGHIIRRKGVVYEVDLTEGIDLSLFLFGNFQNHVTEKKYLSLGADAVILDIGANIGSMALRFAQLVPQGRVFALEPTHYAFNKLTRNLALNPELAKRITPVQLFMSSQTKSNPQIKAYASWKIDGSAQKPHVLHGGTSKSARSVAAKTLDDFCLENNIHRIDLIKIDTDGHELHVLKGAGRTLEKCLPYIIFEIGIYVMNEHHIEFEHYYSYLSSLNYVLLNCQNGKRITLENFRTQIPLRATIDIIAVPSRSH